MGGKVPGSFRAHGDDPATGRSSCSGRFACPSSDDDWHRLDSALAFSAASNTLFLERPAEGVSHAASPRHHMWETRTHLNPSMEALERCLKDQKEDSLK